MFGSTTFAVFGGAVGMGLAVLGLMASMTRATRQRRMRNSVVALDIGLFVLVVGLAVMIFSAGAGAFLLLAAWNGV